MSHHTGSVDSWVSGTMQFSDMPIHTGVFGCLALYVDAQCCVN
jgi:hypothetical protein